MGQHVGIGTATECSATTRLKGVHLLTRADSACDVVTDFERAEKISVQRGTHVEENIASVVGRFEKPKAARPNFFDCRLDIGMQREHLLHLAA